MYNCEQSLDCVAIRSGAHPSPTLTVQGERTITKKYSYGFTLAETLITLVIIGVIAAITVPTLIIKHQKEETVTRLKKAYSTLSQTTARAIADNGPIKTWELGEVTNGNDAYTFVSKYFLPYLNVMKDCKTSTEGNCSYQAYYLNRTPINISSGSYAKFYLSDGTFVSVQIANSDNRYKFLRVYVDINGPKKPNLFGKDIFFFCYYVEFNGLFLPAAGELSRTYLLQNCNKNTSENAGRYCAALIMKDGWRIADDYPW